MPLLPQDPKEFGRYLVLAQVGMEMVAPLVAGVALDMVLGWGPWGAVLGAVLGLVGGLAHLIAVLKKQQEEEDARRRDQR